MSTNHGREESFMLHYLQLSPTSELSRELGFASYLLLMASILSLWFAGRATFWKLLFCGSVFGAFLSGDLRPTGIGIMIIYGSICFFFFHLRMKAPLQLILGLLILVISGLLLTHQLPGFYKRLFLSNFKFSPQAPEKTLYLCFDKPLIGLFLVGFGAAPIRTIQGWKVILRPTLIIAFIATFTLSILAYFFRYVNLDVKWFHFSWIVLLANLLFSCVAEEALFRLFLQNELTKIIHHSNRGQYLSWMVASTLFGTLHIPGGLAYFVLSTLAGLFYGYAYLKTQKIESGILTHFLVNSTHFVLLTYPRLSN